MADTAVLSIKDTTELEWSDSYDDPSAGAMALYAICDGDGSVCCCCCCCCCV